MQVTRLQHSRCVIIIACKLPHPENCAFSVWQNISSTTFDFTEKIFLFQFIHLRITHVRTVHVDVIFRILSLLIQLFIFFNLLFISMQSWCKMKSSIIIFSCVCLSVLCSYSTPLIIFCPSQHFPSCGNLLIFYYNLSILLFVNSALIYNIMTTAFPLSPPFKLSRISQIHLPSTSPEKRAGFPGTTTKHSTSHN